MNAKKILALLMVVLVAASGLAAVPAMASDNVAYDGADASSTDQTDTAVFTEGSSLENVTIQLTEDQSYTADESKFFPTNATPDSASIGAATTAANLAVNTVDDGVYVNETASSANTLNSLNVTFNVSEDPSADGDVVDAIDVSSATDTEQDLIQDPNDSENHTYIVVDRFAEVDYNVNGVDAEFNHSTGTFNVSETGDMQLALDLTRNNTTYEDYSAEKIHVQVGMNTSAFSDISETTSEDADTITLTDVSTADGMTTYTWAIQNPDNNTLEYDLSVNATVMSSDYNETIVVGENHDAVGGVDSTYEEKFDHAMAAGAAPSFPETPLVPWYIWLIAIIVLGAFVYSMYSNKSSGVSGRGASVKALGVGGEGLMSWISLVIAGLGITMVLDGVLPNQFIVFEFDFWANLLGVDQMVPLIVGIVALLAFALMNARR